MAPDVRRIGMTSAGNVNFVDRSGLYDDVLAYDAADALAIDGMATVIDFAGSADILPDLYARLPGRIAHCLRVGATRHDARAGGAIALRPRPIWFSAPDAASALIAETGQDGFNVAVATHWRGFVEGMADIVTVTHGAGAEALPAIWREQVAGRTRPTDGHIVRP